MTPTGHDTIVFTNTAQQTIAKDVCNSLREIWPDYLLDIESGATSEDEISSANAIGRLAQLSLAGHTILCFFRTEAMRRHMHRKGFVPLKNGEGPIAIHLRQRKLPLFHLPHLTEVSAADRYPGEIDPYSAWPCCHELLEVTLVSPADPSSDAFSAKLLTILFEACGVPRNQS